MVSKTEGPGPGLRPQIPPLRPLSIGLCGKQFCLYFPPKSCEDQLHNHSPHLPLPPGPGVGQWEEQSPGPLALPSLPWRGATPRACPPPRASRPRGHARGCTTPAYFLFKAVSLRKQRRQTCCGLWTYEVTQSWGWRGVQGSGRTGREPIGRGGKRGEGDETVHPGKPEGAVLWLLTAFWRPLLRGYARTLRASEQTFQLDWAYWSYSSQASNP